MRHVFSNMERRLREVAAAMLDLRVGSSPNGRYSARDAALDALSPKGAARVSSGFLQRQGLLEADGVAVMLW